MAKRRKILKHSKDENQDYFWLKVVLIGLVVISISVLAGNWMGRYLVGKGVIPRQTPGEQTTPVVPSRPSQGSPTPLEEIPISPFPDVTSSVSAFPSPTVTESKTVEPSPSESETAKSDMIPPKPTSTKKISPEKHLPTKSPSPEKPLHSHSETPSISPTAGESTIEFTIHVGSFAEEENLVKAVRVLKDMGYEPRLTKIEQENKIYNRVEVGSFSTRSQAEEEAKKIEEKGYKPRIVPR